MKVLSDVLKLNESFQGTTGLALLHMQGISTLIKPISPNQFKTAEFVLQSIATYCSFEVGPSLSRVWTRWPPDVPSILTFSVIP